MLSKELVKRTSLKKKEPEWLVRRRLEAFDQFEKLPLPRFKYGLHIMLRPSFDFDALQISMDGKGSADIEMFKDKFGKLIENDKFSALNFAFAKINLIHVRENEHLNFEIDNKDQFSHTLIVAEPNSVLNVAENIVDNIIDTDNNYRSNFVEIYAARNSRVNFISLQNLADVNYISGKYTSVAADAEVNWLDISLGAKFAKSDVVSFLRGKNAATRNYGLFLGNGEQQFDLRAAAIHESAETKSDILMKGILKDKAKSLYRGLVRIEKEAAGSDGYQKEEVLLLSEEAEADAIPNLQIENENVRCTHGASIGKIDEEKLFYLMSRGLSREQAVKLIVEGFFDSLLVKTNAMEMKDFIMEKLR